ncbi:phage holin family protein [Sinomonas sp. JGH33]|uniref:Phage holin family protein n=1 Tax=Sinomonas terricola TaxID=3110330 RepID=A0ABU5T817_9MICC|nr:phage holin family protein [Sinomonas sp. JGH33]MEA5455818.1 phage holin family protein [Sinomonas sp. JGH33]
MMRFLLRVVVNAFALWVATWILPGLKISSNATAGIAANAGAGSSADTVGLILAYLFIGLIFGLVNALVRPVVELLSLPVTCLTLGLFALVINAAMLALTSWISGYTPVHLTIDSFLWTAVFGAIIISIVSAIMGRLLGASRRD